MALIIFNRKNAMEDWQSGWIRDDVNTYTFLWNTWKGWSSEKKERSIFEKTSFRARVSAPYLSTIHVLFPPRKSRINPVNSFHDCACVGYFIFIFH